MGSSTEFLPTNFTLPEGFCKMSAASLGPEPSPMTEDRDGGRPADGPEDGDGAVPIVEDGDHIDVHDDEDDGVVWLDDEDDEEE